MTKQPHRPPAKKPSAEAVDSVITRQPSYIPLQQTTKLYQGPTPQPEMLDGYERLVPGSAARMIQWAEDESNHRRRLEAEANASNVATQAKQLAIADYQARSVTRSDMIGQLAGLAVSLSCVVGAVYLSINGHDWTGAALAAIPTAAVIQAFFAKRIKDEAVNADP